MGNKSETLNLSTRQIQLNIPNFILKKYKRTDCTGEHNVFADLQMGVPALPAARDLLCPLQTSMRGMEGTQSPRGSAEERIGRIDTRAFAFHRGGDNHHAAILQTSITTPVMLCSQLRY